jgi:cobalt/nickel transport system permease protein
LRRTRIAMSARSQEASGIAPARALATAAGALFIRSYERGERVHQAMLARGFTGDFPSTFADSTAPTRWWPTLAPALAASATMALARMIS